MRNQNKNVLVHCHAGVSRSAAIVCAYLMNKKGIGLQQALFMIKTRRDRVKPNENFLRILKEYERETVKNNPLESRAHSSTKPKINHYDSYERLVSSSHFRSSLDLPEGKNNLVSGLSQHSHSWAELNLAKKANHYENKENPSLTASKRRPCNPGISVTSKKGETRSQSALKEKQKIFRELAPKALENRPGP